MVAKGRGQGMGEKRKGNIVNNIVLSFTVTDDY